jgi:class 3 adenylate cyclase
MMSQASTPPGPEARVLTTGDALDYFGAIVNIAARLEHQCRGCEVIVSEAVAKDAETEAALADRERLEETAMLRGVSAPARYVRVAVGGATDHVRRAP